VQAHEGDFQANLVEPFKELVTRAADGLPQEWLSYLETEKNVIARMRKNDWGRGGAWPYLWGAFYPRSGRRISDAQLYVSVQSDQFQVGFAIGAREKQVQERFWRNVGTLVNELDDALWPYLAQDKRFRYGNADSPVSSLAEWLDSGQDATVFVALSPEETLKLTREELDSHVGAILQKVWPLFLLAILDEPWPAIVAYLGIEQPDERNPIVSRAAVAARLSLPESFITTWLAGLERKKQAILYGPPGTGKTYAARALADHLIGGGYGRTELVQFHPAYAYEDFIEGIRPAQGREGQLTYPIKAGVLRAFCDEARQRPDSTYVLIIDEINRANLSRVFGELMYLLEYRGDEVRLAVSGQAFSIPKNVRIIGTMNTADRSIALVDHALRRRFAFIRLAPEWGIVQRYFADRDLAGVDLNALHEELDRLNHEIEADYRVGITFFLQDGLGRHLASIWRMEIEPYLEEYFFDQPAKVEAYRWVNVQNKVLADDHHAD
jgi:5-methylcytosine-specific restriction protein B